MIGLDKVVSVSFGEIALKGNNRIFFENKLVKHIKGAIKDLGRNRVYKEQSKIYIDTQGESIDMVVNRLKKVFGIVYISPCYRVEKDIEEMKKHCVIALKELMSKKDIKTFKVKVNRADKKFPLNSMELARELGGYVLSEVEGIGVDVHNPDVYINVDVRNKSYVYTEKIKAYGGLPLGTNGRGLLLLSGGIDSPVAGFMIAKRGVDISAVHYHSYPFTSERAEDKVKELATILARYCGRIKLYSVNILDIQKEINAKCPEDEMTIISRRFMMKIAEEIAIRNNIDALITGESLGQVASQTIKGINVTNAAISIPAFRPLIGMDKVEITEIAKDIETFETSILPYEDCCTVFLPKHPVTKPLLADIEKSEEALDVNKLVEDAISNMSIMTIEP